MPVEKDSWIKRNGTNLIVGLLSTAVVGVVQYVQKLKSEIDELKIIYNVHAAKDEDREIANQEQFEAMKTLLQEHENEVDHNREDIIRLQDIKQDRK